MTTHTPYPGVRSFSVLSQPTFALERLWTQEQTEFLESLGLAEPAKNRFVEAAYELIELISMLTSGEDECRAWPIRRNTVGPKAAGKIHSDIERGFIRAEVVTYDDLLSYGSRIYPSHCAKSHGFFRVPRDYSADSVGSAEGVPVVSRYSEFVQ